MADFANTTIEPGSFNYDVLKWRYIINSWYILDVISRQSSNLGILAVLLIFSLTK